MCGLEARRWRWLNSAGTSIHVNVRDIESREELATRELFGAD